MTMSREFSQETNLTIRAGDALKDPLVINLTGAPVALSQDKFAFDLNADGQNEQIGMVKSGSGFLVLDKNHDGIVNDGSELFGPTSGNGYQELAAYDGDKNGAGSTRRIRSSSNSSSGAGKPLIHGSWKPGGQGYRRHLSWAGGNALRAHR